MLLTSARAPYGCTKPGWPCFEKGDSVKCGHYVIKWIEMFCVATQGHWVQKPANLIEWEKEFLIELFGINPELGLRQYRWTLLGIPKKNGKTELAAWLGLYLLVGDDEPSPWVACAAASDQQADLVFGATHKCADWAPHLKDIIVPQAQELIVPSSPGASLRRLSARAGTNDGPSWHAVICDELHQWEGKAGRDLWTVLTNGVGARRQPLIIQITTAGVDVEGTLCGEQYLLGQKLAEDPDIDPRYLFWWYQADTGANWTEVETWKDANPSWGFTLPDPEAYLRDQIRKKRESEFKRFFLNIWMESEDVWLEDGLWDGCFDPHLEFDDSLPLYVGIDGALKRDSFAIVAAQKQDDRLVTQAAIWENPYPKGHELSSRWKLNLEEPLNLLRRLYMDFPEPAVYTDEDGYLPGPAFGYDPHYIEYAAQVLEAEGLNMVTVAQTPARMAPASEFAYELIKGRLIRHDGDKRYRRHIHGAIPIVTERGWRIGKPKGSPRHIDAAIALIIAISVAYDPAADDIEDTEGIPIH